MEEKIDTPQEQRDAKDIILDLNFVPQWARKPPGENHYSREDYVEERRPQRREGRRPPRSDDRRSSRRDDRPRRPRPDQEARPPQGERRRPPREPFKELPISVSFLPEQKHLASLVRQVHHSRRAYPLMDLANLMIQDAEGYLVKVELQDAPADFRLFQCKQCKSVMTSEEAMKAHVLEMHLCDFYDQEEIESEPPAGNFPGVARCRKTGILLGPPNHHSYTEKVTQVHQSRFAHLSLDEYKRNIEVVRDEELVEQWKQEARKQTVYKLKSDAEAEPVDRRRAEIEFSKKVDSLYESTRRAIVPAKVAQQLSDRDVLHAIRQIWAKESRFPLTMSFSMRAAFRHMHLHLFKAGKINFVTHVKPNPIAPEETIEAIAEVLVFLKEHPGSTRKNLLEMLHPSLDPQSKEAKEALQPLGWLIERGHIIEFFNGTLSVPLGRKRR